jgi:uncharacterized protein (DUF952 family)
MINFRIQRIPRRRPRDDTSRREVSTPMLIYKIATAADFHVAEKGGRFEGSAHDKADGFIHFSTASQLKETLALYYAGVNDILLVAVDAGSLGAALKWEHAPSRGEDFPHLYAALPLSSVKWTHALMRDAQGNALIPDMVFARP